MSDKEEATVPSSETSPAVASSIALETVKEDSRVLLLAQDGSYMLHRMKLGTLVRVNRKRIKCDPIVGAPYGSVFRLVGDELRRVENAHVDEASKHSGMCLPITYLTLSRRENLTDLICLFEIADINFLPSADNSSLVDNTNHQAIQCRQIEEMKETCSGEELIALLQKNSKTFASKTEFSQEKWLRKKRRQYISEVRVIKPTALSLASSYQLKKPEKILHMRPDTLALILNKASIRPYSQVLVMEDAVGLVTGAIAKRMGGYGRILSGFSGPSGANADCIGSLNLCPRTKKSIVFFPLTLINAAKKQKSTDAGNNENVVVSVGDLEEADSTNSSRIPHEKIVNWLAFQSDSLVIASRADIPQSVFGLLPLLASGGSLVVYSPYIEPLNEVARKLRSTKGAVLVQVAENFYREYQVEPNRTHPLNNMSGSGGFILSAIKIAPNSTSPQPASLDTPSTSSE